MLKEGVDHDTGTSVQTIYDQNGNYVITIDSQRGLVNTRDRWGGNNPYDVSTAWGWGMTGFRDWTKYSGPQAF